MKKFFITLCLLTFLIMPSYADVSTTMNRLMDSWLGETIDKVIGVWGSPASVKETDNGKIYYWTSGNKPFAIDNYSGKMTGAMISCNKIFKTDKDNKIVDWQWDGNNCPRKISDVKKLINPLNAN